MSNELLLRNVINEDLSIFFQYQLDPEANHMAAFTARDPTNQEAFMAHWHSILAEETNIIQTILCNGQVAGSVSSYLKRRQARSHVLAWQEILGSRHCHLGVERVFGEP